MPPATPTPDRPVVSFYFDPACPWTWVTSRWLVAAADERGLELDWRPFSLMILNGEDVPDEYRRIVTGSHRALRVMVRLGKELGGDAVAAFYAERGHRVFDDGEEDPDIAEVLTAAGLDPAYADAATDVSLDADIRSSMAEARELAGEAAASPTLAVDGRGFFGPVLTAVPEDPGALWDALMELWSVPELAELKRGRPAEPSFPGR